MRSDERIVGRKKGAEPLGLVLAWEHDCQDRGQVIARSADHLQVVAVLSDSDSEIDDRAGPLLDGDAGHKVDVMKDTFVVLPVYVDCSFHKVENRVRAGDVHFPTEACDSELCQIDKHAVVDGLGTSVTVDDITKERIVFLHR